MLSFFIDFDNVDVTRNANERLGGTVFSTNYLLTHNIEDHNFSRWNPIITLRHPI